VGGFSSPGQSDQVANRPSHGFEIGEIVRGKNEHIPGHVRMPAYICGKLGGIITRHYPFPDAAGHGMQAPTEPTYDVRFRSEEL
jgi:hypothetical protein